MSPLLQNVVPRSESTYKSNHLLPLAVSQLHRQEAQLSLGKIDIIAYIRRPAWNFRSQKESNFP